MTECMPLNVHMQVNISLLKVSNIFKILCITLALPHIFITCTNECYRYFRRQCCVNVTHCDSIANTVTSKSFHVILTEGNCILTTTYLNCNCNQIQSLQSYKSACRINGTCAFDVKPLRS